MSDDQRRFDDPRWSEEQTSLTDHDESDDVEGDGEEMEAQP